MGGKETIAFTLKGPISIQFIESSTEQCRRTGTAMVDLCFQSPSQIGELVFSNYYTAWISVYVKKGPAKMNNPGATKAAPGTNQRTRPNFERSISVDLSGRNTFDKGNGDLLELETMHSSVTSVSSGPSRRRHSSGPNSAEMSDRPWECCIPMKTLMPWPHYENGCQDVFSIPATESLVELRDVNIMRIVLHQPSTVWKRFSIEDINVFRSLPKRGCSQADDVSRQREGWIATLRLNTKKMLGGLLVEPEKYESDEAPDA